MMTKWEYATLLSGVQLGMLAKFESHIAKLVHARADGKHQILEDQFGTLLAGLGNNGWELVGVGETNGNNRLYPK